MTKKKLLTGVLLGTCAMGVTLNLNVYAEENKEKVPLISEDETSIISELDKEKDIIEQEKNENEDIKVIDKSEVKDEVKPIPKEDTNISRIGKTLEDVLVKADTKLPTVVGINASKSNSDLKEFPMLPGFKETQNGVIGYIPNGDRTAIEIYAADLVINGKESEHYIVKISSSDIEKDKTLKAYIEYILNFYSGKKYSIDVGGIETTITIKK